MSRRDRHDRILFAADACAIDRHNGTGPRGESPLDDGLIDVEGVGPDVHKHRYSVSQVKRVRGLRDRVPRHDYLVTRSDTEE